MTQTENPRETARGLARIRILRRTMAALVIAFIPLLFLLSWIETSEQTIMKTGISIICLAVVMEFIIGFSRCPSCRGYFHVRGMSSNFFTKKCMNCGVPLK